MVGAGEVRIEVESVAMQDGGFGDSMLEDQMNRFEVRHSACLKVERFHERRLCEGLARIICVKDWLLKFLQDCTLMKLAQIEPVEVLRSPEFCLLQLLLMNGLVSERHDVQVSFIREQTAVRLEELVPRD